MAVVFDIAAFRALFPEFSVDPPYSDAVLTMQWDTATLYVTPENCGDLLDGKRAYAIQLMVAHLFRLGKVIASNPAGGTPVQVSGATIDKVAVTLTPPPGKDMWGYWLGLTPYGQMLVSYLSMQAVGGFYVGGLPERSAFRKVGGVF